MPDRTRGLSAVTLAAPYSAAPYGGTKSNHFLPQVLTQMVAQEMEADLVRRQAQREGGRGGGLCMCIWGGHARGWGGRM